jgi:hypothetical protein
MNTQLHSLRRAVRIARLADMPVSAALETLADMPEAKAFYIDPEMLRRMLLESLPEQYARFLFERAGYRVRVPLADLAYLARYDQTLLDVVTSVILWLDGEHALT